MDKSCELGIADIEALRPEQIVHVHINDAPDIPVAEALDNGRLYPGEVSSTSRASSAH